MSEIEKALYELKKLMKYRAEQLGHTEEFRGLGLTSRKNLCLHPSVRREKSGAVVDARCRSLTAGFVKEKKERGEDVPVCIYHDVGPSPFATRPSYTKFSRIWIFSNPITSSRTEYSLLRISRDTEKSISNAHTSQQDGWYVPMMSKGTKLMK
jgi:DNA excision repair protein ERCC-2